MHFPVRKQTKVAALNTIGCCDRFEWMQSVLLSSYWLILLNRFECMPMTGFGCDSWRLIEMRRMECVGIEQIPIGWPVVWNRTLSKYKDSVHSLCKYWGSTHTRTRMQAYSIYMQYTFMRTEVILRIHSALRLHCRWNASQHPCNSLPL